MQQELKQPKTKLRNRLEKLLEGTEIQFNGPNEWDVQVHDARLYKRVFSGGSLAFGEAYMDGWWDCARIDVLLTKLISIDIKQRMRLRPRDVLDIAAGYAFNQQTRKKAPASARRHYDMGNELFRTMLDKHWTYSCAYWDAGAKTLDDAQEAKYALICKKLGLEKGQRVLDIGCGWGGLLKYMAEHHGVSAVGITPAREQVAEAKQRCAGLPIEILEADYRQIMGKFDHVVSLGMFEHVGWKNFRTYMQVARRSLKDGGLFLLHTIGANKSSTSADPWLRKYVFPGHQQPSLKQISKACEGVFVVEDVHNFGASYDQTLMAWHANFCANWETIKSRYDERFYRLWTYYLLSSAASFRARNNQLYQIVLSPNGVKGGYASVR